MEEADHHEKEQLHAVVPAATQQPSKKAASKPAPKQAPAAKAAAKAAAKPAAKAAAAAKPAAKPAAAAPPAAAKPAKVQPTGHDADADIEAGDSSTHSEPQGKQPRVVLGIILLIVLSCMAAVGVVLYIVLRDGGAVAGRRLLLLR